MARLANAPKPLPDSETLNMLYRYDQGSGKIYWRERPVSSFAPAGRRSAEYVAKNWNTKFAGKEIGSLNGGYLKCSVMGQNYLVHRIIWKMEKGSDPIQIDHIDGNKLNNRIGNLRDVSHQVNAKNRKLYECNTSGMPGVTFHGRDKVWQVRIGVGRGEDIHLGTFKSKETAIAVRIAAQQLLDYHENHGRKVS